jgi:hypothetical protein
MRRRSMRASRPTEKAGQPSDQVRTTLHQSLPLVEVAESWMLDMLMADSIAGRLIVARIAERYAAVVPGQADALLQRMRKLGHTPRVIEGAP